VYVPVRGQLDELDELEELVYVLDELDESRVPAGGLA
jgi:hypothetical protein